MPTQLQTRYARSIEALKTLRASPYYLDQLFFSSELFPEERILWYGLQQFVEPSGVCNPSLKDMEELVAIPERTLTRYLNSLIKKRCVRRYNRPGGRNNEYEIVVPDWWRK